MTIEIFPSAIMFRQRVECEHRRVFKFLCLFCKCLVILSLKLELFRIKKEDFFFLAGGEINEFSVFHMQTNTQNREPESVDFVNFLYVVDDVYDDDDVDFF